MTTKQLKMKTITTFTFILNSFFIAVGQNSDPHLAVSSYNIASDYSSFLPENSITIKNSAIQLDSIYEETYVAIYDFHYRHYYSYNNKGLLDSSIRIYYNSQDEYRGKVEKSIYNLNGYLSRRRTYETKLPQYGYLADSNHELTQDETYIYSNSLLTKEDVVYKNNPAESYSSEYEYDSIGRLLHKNGNGKFGSEKESYFYNNNKLEYDVLRYGSSSYVITKHFYEYTDTSCLHTSKGISSQFEITQLDTISIWDPEHAEGEYYEKYDALGRRIYFSYAYYWRNKKYEVLEANYMYNEKGKLSHISYFTSPNRIWEEPLIENIRIHFTYDNNDNIDEFTKTYLDAKTFTWEIENHKKYYYRSQELSIINSLKPDFNIYPNPTESSINLPDSYIGKHYSIYNTFGSKLKQGILTSNTLKVTQLNKGYYIFKIANTTHTFIKY